ncbi:MAG: ribonuclease HI [Parcubacteria group bacterium Athens0714_26]|nr:MAG: ribonuclease HI [Parcubacteria group bacterium Athens0714_26]
MKNKKYYAYFVIASNLKGVTDSWAECQKKVSGKEARFKGFKSEREAKEWLESGSKYEEKQRIKLEKAVYFDAGTGRGKGVEISVTDEKGQNLLVKVMLPQKINRFGKHIIKEKVTNYYGELLAMKYALKFAIKSGTKKIFGDSKLVINYWSKGFFNKKNVFGKTLKLISEVTALRKKYEKSGGSIGYVPGGHNPADLGFH